MSRGTTQTRTAAAATAAGNKSRLIVSITTSMRDIEPPEGGKDGARIIDCCYGPLRFLERLEHFEGGRKAAAESTVRRKTVFSDRRQMANERTENEDGIID